MSTWLRNLWGMSFWWVFYVSLCVYLLGFVSVCDCECVWRVFVTVKIMIPLLSFLLFLQWTESITMTNPESSCGSLCACTYTQTYNCHTSALSVWTSRIDFSAIETPVRSLSWFIAHCFHLWQLKKLFSFCFSEKRWTDTFTNTHANTHPGYSTFAHE